MHLTMCKLPFEPIHNYIHGSLEFFKMTSLFHFFIYDLDRTLCKSISRVREDPPKDLIASSCFRLKGSKLSRKNKGTMKEDHETKSQHWD